MYARRVLVHRRSAEKCPKRLETMPKLVQGKHRLIYESLNPKETGQTLDQKRGEHKT